MWVCLYFIEFILFSFLGWIWETILCIFVNKRWESRGFLFGPVCPIYGVGAIGGFILLDTLEAMQMPALTWWQVILIAFFGSAVLEYGTSYILEKLFHAYWWDYSDWPLNLNGRVSLFSSLGFAAAGLLVVYGLYPFCHWLFSFVSGGFIEIIAMIFLAVLMVDVTLTVSSLTNMVTKIMQLDDSLNERMTDVVEMLYSNTSQLNRRVIARIRGVRFKKPTQIKAFRKLMEKIRKSCKV